MTRLVAAARGSARVLVAPDSFKGTHSAGDVAAAVATGLRNAGADPVSMPLADGGEGTLEALRRSTGGALHHLSVTGPDGRPVDGSFLLSSDRGTAVVETASASGLTLVAPDRRDPWRATTRGTGELIAAAARSGAERILLGVGGSATTDGGAGAIEAILEQGGLRDSRLEILCDVTTPFERAAAVFGPQKGADDAMVARLGARLEQLAAELPRDPRGVARTGCAGGLSGGLWAQFGAELHSGIEVVLDALDFDSSARRAVAVITGEGRLDAQTAAGKVVAGVVGACAENAADVPVHAVVGQTLLSDTESAALGLVTVSVASTTSELIDAGRRLGVRILQGEAAVAPGGLSSTRRSRS